MIEALRAGVPVIAPCLGVSPESVERAQGADGPESKCRLPGLRRIVSCFPGISKSWIELLGIRMRVTKGLARKSRRIARCSPETAGCRSRDDHDNSLPTCGMSRKRWTFITGRYQITKRR